MKKKILLVCLITANVFATFANKTIYVNSTVQGNGDGTTPATACKIRTAIESNLDATGTSTIVFPSNATFQVTTSDGNTPTSGCILVANATTKKIIFEGNNSTILGTDGVLVRLLRLGSGTNVELRNLTFKNGNHTSALGGGVYFGGDSLKISGCTFDNNLANYGGAFASRGKYVKISNSYFINNKLSAVGKGGAMTVTGTTAGGTLIIENTTFNNNNNTGVTGTCLGTAICTANDGYASAGTFSAYLTTILISNCTFYKNVASVNTNNQCSAIYMDELSSGGTTNATFVNNTFYGNSNTGLYIVGAKQTVTLVNNVIAGDSYATVSGSGVQDFGILTSATIGGGRPAIIAKNNYIVTKSPINSSITESTLQPGNNDNNTLVTIASQNDIDVLGLSTALQTSGSVVPYLGTSAMSSPLVEAGISTYSGITISTTDARGVIRGIGSTGSKFDIGAYEFDHVVTGIQYISEEFFTLNQTAGEISIDNQGGNALLVNMYSTNGQNIYSANVNKSLTIRRNQLPKGVMILSVNNGLKTVTKKIVL